MVIERTNPFPSASSFDGLAVFSSRRFLPGRLRGLSHFELIELFIVIFSQDLFGIDSHNQEQTPSHLSVVVSF